MSYARGRSAGGGASSISFGASSASAPVVSSNKFSNGSNQNCGNVITGRSSTRIHAPAGGRSQISFGSSDAGMSKVSSNKYSSGANQNCGNVITGRSSTRIHAPAGGHTSISLGSAPMKPSTKTNIRAPAASAKAAPKAAPARRTTSSNKFSNGSNQNCGNVITNRPSTRVRAPPGGHSQISF